MKAVSTCLLISAAVFFVIAAHALRTGKTVPAGAYGTGYLLGLFLPSAVCLIAGLFLRNRAANQEQL
ncbi:MAG: hypothetical protein KDB80_05470 [Planctomycetes bacterium]|nr:hypothetical protein [Planctomycetota bacterium]